MHAPVLSCMHQARVALHSMLPLWQSAGQL